MRGRTSIWWLAGALLVAGAFVVAGISSAGTGSADPQLVRAGESREAATLAALLHASPPPALQPPPPRETLTPPLGAERTSPDDGGPAAALDELVDTLTEVLDHDDAPSALGFALVDGDGELVLGHQPDAPLLPASTTKLVTAAAALTTLGPDHRFTTTVEAAGDIDDGVVDGDLVLRGGGDPVLGDERQRTISPQRPHTAIEDLADALVDAGVEEVRGHVVGDASILPWQPEAAGWLDRYLWQGHTARSSGLTVNRGRRLRERDGQLIAETADSPALEATRVLVDLLEERDVTVTGTAGLTDAHDDHDHPLASVDSPPLGELLIPVVQRSDNLLADAVWRMVGREHGDGSWESASDAGLAVLADLGVDTADAVLADGSGLSRDSRLTARQLAQLDAVMARSEHGEVWSDLMAVSGESGTLRNRLRDTMASGALRGKTGTLADVRGLAGSVHGPEGRWHLAVLAGDLDATGVTATLDISDELAVVLARHTLGCDLDGC